MLGKLLECTIGTMVRAVQTWATAQPAALAVRQGKRSLAPSRSPSFSSREGMGVGDCLQVPVCPRAS
eukprot:1365909-Prymnesium_polylepis.1